MRVCLCACACPIHVCAAKSAVYVCVSTPLPRSLLSSLLPPLLHPSHPPSFFPCAVQFLDSEQINRGRRRVGGGGRCLCGESAPSLSPWRKKAQGRRRGGKQRWRRRWCSLAETTLMGYCEPIMSHSH